MRVSDIHTPNVTGGGITISASMILTPRQIYGAFYFRIFHGISLSCNFARCPFDNSASKEWCHLHPDHPPGQAKLKKKKITRVLPWESLGCPGEIWSGINQKFIVMWGSLHLLGFHIVSSDSDSDYPHHPHLLPNSLIQSWTSIPLLCTMLQ